MSVYLRRDTLDLILNSKFELHCLSVKIWQNLPDGVELSGHGAIKQNKYGTLYLEFICTNTKYTMKGDLVTQFQRDRFAPSQKLLGKFISLNGTRFTSEDFSIDVNAFNRKSPHILHIQLPFITFVEDRLSDSCENYLYYEFAESLHIPANVSNIRTPSSTKSESHC